MPQVTDAARRLAVEQIIAAGIPRFGRTETFVETVAETGPFTAEGRRIIADRKNLMD